MSTKKATKEITSEKFAKFLAWLSADEAQAAIEYERLRFRLHNFFAQRQCRFPEELADETINRVIVRIDQEFIDKRIPYCYGVAKIIWRETQRKEKQMVEIEEAQLSAAPTEEKEVMQDCLDKCLQQLPEADRRLLLTYFSQDKAAKIELHRQLADEQQMSLANLRMRVLRLKQKLKICLQICLE